MDKLQSIKGKESEWLRFLKPFHMNNKQFLTEFHKRVKNQRICESQIRK